MTQRMRYHITRRPDGRWQGKAEGAERPSVVAETKAKAIEETVAIARRHAPSQVFIHGENGRIQSERTYGADPYPPLN